MKESTVPYTPTRSFWWALRVGFSALVLGLLGIRSLFPVYPVDAVTIGLVALLVLVWILPFLAKFSLPGGVGGVFSGVPPPSREIPQPGTGVGPAVRAGRESLTMTLSLRMRKAQTPEERSFYATLVETAVFLKLENEHPPPDFEVQRYPMIIVDGRPTGVSFHAIIRSRRWPGRRFYYIENAVGEITEDRVYRILEDLRRRADVTNRVLGNAPNEYLLVFVSDFAEDRNRREWLNRVANRAQSAVAVPSFSCVLCDLTELPI